VKAHWVHFQFTNYLTSKDISIYVFVSSGKMQRLEIARNNIFKKIFYLIIPRILVENFPG
jgi:hypothetical protein